MSLVSPSARLLRRKPFDGSPRSRGSRAIGVLGSVGILLALIAGWEGIMAIARPPGYLLPYPHDIFNTWRGSLGDYLSLGWNTARVALLGAALGTVVAVVAGSLVAQLDWVVEPALSYAAMLQATPLVVLTPVAQVWFGGGTWSTAAVVAVAVFPPILIATVRGLEASSSVVERLMASYAASRRQTYLKVRLPAALPMLMSGLKVAAPTALIVAIVAELFGGSIDTLGTVMRQEALLYHTTAVWAAALTAVIFGLVIYGMVDLAERALLHGRRSTRTL